MRALILSCALLLSLPAAAQQQRACMPLERLTQILRDEYRETLAATGAMEGGAQMLLFVSDGGQTWTLAIVSPSGIACVGPAGGRWRPTRSRA